MKVSELELKNFKRFTDLTIKAIPPEAKLVVLIGPNGCGKSSIFDAFEQIGGRGKNGFQEDQTYLRKDQSKEFFIALKTDAGTYQKGSSIPKKSFYIRSAHRFDADFQTSSIGKKDDVLNDPLRPKRLIDIDKKVQDNYERLVGATVQGLYSGEKDNLSVSGLRTELIGKVRESMARVFDDLLLESTGDPFQNGQFYFTKGTVKNFPFKNLSAGEKNAFDLVLDFVIKSQDFDNTVFVIDEPELHMHSRLQRNLLKELYQLIPTGCQVWVATHSIGFLRGAIELKNDNQNEVSLLNFDNRNFDDIQVIEPITPSARVVREIFSVALDDLSSMVTPNDIIFCEGSVKDQTLPVNRELDAEVYNVIFKDRDVLFVSADNKGKARDAAKLLIKIVLSSGAVRDIKSVVDRDELTDEQVATYRSQDPSQKFLGRRSIENYLFDSEIIDKYCHLHSIQVEKVTARLTDVKMGDGKAIQGSLMQQCGWQGEINDFKKELAQLVTPDTETYKALAVDIWT